MSRWLELEVMKCLSLGIVQAGIPSPEVVSTYFTELKRSLEKIDLLDKSYCIFNVDENVPSLTPPHRAL